MPDEPPKLEEGDSDGKGAGQLASSPDAQRTTSSAETMPESRTADGRTEEQGASKMIKKRSPDKAEGGGGSSKEDGADREEEEEEDDDEDNDEEEEDEEEEDGQEEDDEEDEEEEEEEEPRLKYARLTQNLAGIYRNGDATSTFIVAGDKMVVGTHNGNIHVFQLPAFETLRVYHAHSASVTAISISPYPPPLGSAKAEQLGKLVADTTASTSRPASRQADASSSPTTSPRKAREPATLPNIPSNHIYIATASTDGNVCVQSLIDLKDVQLRNFARPVQTVALSPDYRQDRTYLSGGLAGNMILTVGGQAGRSTSTTVGTAAAAASGWLGSMGLGANTGRDTVLHAGEGTINTIKWSLSGKYAVWLNEHGIKIMRTRIQLDSADADSAWKRIGHIDRPQTEEWDTMASVWKGRAEWIDEQTVDDDESSRSSSVDPEPASSRAADRLREQMASSDKSVERLLVGWGSTLWIIHVHPGGVGIGKEAGERSVGRVDIAKILRMDCIISGILLYTRNLLMVLAYSIPEDDEESDADEAQKQGNAARGHKSRLSAASHSSEPSGGIPRRQNNLPPELRLIDLHSQAEVGMDGLGVSRFERLSAGDYHLGVLPAQTAAAAASSKGALEALADLGTDMWNAAINPKMLFSSGASIRSRGSNETPPPSSSRLTAASALSPHSRFPRLRHVHPSMAQAGIKIFIHSPYDCILATRRDVADHLDWLLEHEEFQKAWELIDENPAAVRSAANKVDADSTLAAAAPTDDFFSDSSLDVDARSREANSLAEREKRRVGELWIKAVVETGDWERAGQIAGKVLRTADRWEKWVWTFAGADQLDAITNYIPMEPLQPPIPRTVYEVVLGHYLKVDKLRFRVLLDRWPVDLFDISTVVAALENQLKYRDVREDSVEDGQKGRDWRIVVESLARMHEANGRQREALKKYIQLQDADAAFRLIRDFHLADAVMDDIPSFITLRVSASQASHMTASELQEATAEAVTILVDEAQHGLVRPETVVAQLEERSLHLYTFFYLRGLWKGDGVQDHLGESRDRLILESRAQLDGFADLVVHLLAMFDRSLLMEFLKSSTSYAFEKAVSECEKYNYIDELVYLYSKTGQMKRALYLIIDRLGDVHRAITFAKEQDDPDLWNDLLNYSMDKPRFIRGLLEGVGTAIDPITLVRRIPEGLEIEGLRSGLRHIMREHEVQRSISAGAAKVLRSEVAAAQARLRRGQSRGIRFDVPSVASETGETKEQPGSAAGSDGPEGQKSQKGQASDEAKGKAKGESGIKIKPGHCAKCGAAFTEWETDTLVGFACGHVFHLSHLLGLAPGEAASRGFSGPGDDVPHSRRNMIGSKVTHARLLRDSLRGGCAVCRPSEGALRP